MYILHSSILGTQGDVLIPIKTRAGNLETIGRTVLTMWGFGGATGLLLMELYTYNTILSESISENLVDLPEGVNKVMDVLYGEGAVKTTLSWFGANMLPVTLYLPTYSYTPEEIFKGRIAVFDVNFFKNKEIKTWTSEKHKNIKIQYYEDENGKELFKDENGNSIRGHLASAGDEMQREITRTIGRWYKTIRNICIVAMLSILVYIGIRILLSTVANDKAKYKQMLVDWFMGLCLLFLMHYIMAFSVAIVEKITDMVESAEPLEYYSVLLPKDETLKEAFEEMELKEYVIETDKNYAWNTNLMGYLRVTLQMQTAGMRYVGEVICFLILVVLTIMFTFMYFKRFLYMAFLTVISPLVALTYCIDKINDGRAQGFNTWFKEYIFNLLIQPMHLLLYYILVSSAFSMMGKNIVYSIVALSFMLPAEKLLRNLFGFERAKTPGTIGNTAVTAAMMGGIHKLTGIAGRNRRKNTEKEKEGEETSNNYKIHSVDMPEDILEGKDEKETNSTVFNPQFDLKQEKINQEKIRTVGLQPNIWKQGIAGDTTGETFKTRKLSGSKKAMNLARQGRAITAATKVAGKRILKATPRTLKGIATGIAVGGAAAIAGTAATAVTGDPEKIATAISAGIAGGYVAGKTATNSKLSDKISPEVKKAYYKELENNKEEQEEIETNAYYKNLYKELEEDEEN